ncbi:hypothetical protein FDUTEX481_04437 [Tolypothrix sp. PCC 7601]|nr:hypothetical protein FDUTEX481_04437 [Tolypothrix sp. PCC 7601]
MKFLGMGQFNFGFCVLLRRSKLPVACRKACGIASLRDASRTRRAQPLVEKTKVACGEPLAVDGFPGISKVVNPKEGSPRPCKLFLA